MTAGEDPLRFLLDGLGVADLAELKRLIDAGRDGFVFESEQEVALVRVLLRREIRAAAAQRLPSLRAACRLLGALEER